jgi:hypothetical protein
LVSIACLTPEVESEQPEMLFEVSFASFLRLSGALMRFGVLLMFSAVLGGARVA